MTIDLTGKNNKFFGTDVTVATGSTLNVNKVDVGVTASSTSSYTGTTTSTTHYLDKLTEKSYSVTYNPNYIGGSSIVKQHSGTIKLASGTIFNAPEGKKFASWNLSSDGKSTSYEQESEQKFSEDVILYAIWKTGYQENNTQSNTVLDYYDIIPETTFMDEKPGGLFNSDDLVRVKYTKDAYDNLSQELADEIRYKLKNNLFLYDNNKITSMFDWCNNDDYVATGIRTKTFQVIESLDYLDEEIKDFTKTIPLYKISKVNGENVVTMVGVYETTIHDIKMNNYINNEGKCITTVLLLYSKNKYYLTDKKIMSVSQAQIESGGANNSNNTNETIKFDYSSGGIYDILNYSYNEETHKYTCSITNPSATSKRLKGDGKKMSRLYLAVSVRDVEDINLYRNRSDRDEEVRKIYKKYRNGWYVPYVGDKMLGVRIENYDNIVFDESLIQIPKGLKYKLESEGKDSTIVEYYFVLKDGKSGRVHKSYKEFRLFKINKTL